MQSAGQLLDLKWHGALSSGCHSILKRWQAAHSLHLQEQDHHLASSTSYLLRFVTCCNSGIDGHSEQMDAQQAHGASPATIIDVT